MAVLTKTQLEQNRIDNIYPNLNNEVGAGMVAQFCDNFIDSIYDYTDKKWGDISVFNGTNIGIENETYLNIADNYINFSTGTEWGIKLNESYVVYSWVDTGDIYITTPRFFFNNSVDISADGSLSIGSDTGISNPKMEFIDDDITISTNMDNGQFNILDTSTSTELFNLSQGSCAIGQGMTFRVGTNTGINTDLIIGNPILNATLEINGGIITNVDNADGWDVQIDIFDQSTTNPIQGIFIDIYSGTEGTPPTGQILRKLTTDSIGRATFISNPNSVYRLHIYGGVYDDIYPLLSVDSDPKIEVYSLDSTA